MSNERFDRLMRKNLESVRPAYQKSAWNRFRKRLPLVGLWPWLLNYGGWILSGLMLTAWMTTLYTLREKQQEIRQLTRKMTTATHIPSNLLVSDSPSLAAEHRVDTIYIVKRTIVEYQHYYQSEQGQWNIFNPSARSRPDAFTFGPADNAPQQTRIPVPGHPEISVNAPNRAGYPANSDRIVRSAPPEKEETELPIKNREQATTIPEKVPPVLDQTGSVPEENAGTDSADVAKTVKDSVASAPLSVPPAAPAVPKIRHPFRLSTLKPRVGIESMGTLSGSIGAGPTVEVFPDENLGLSLGLQASQQNTENLHALQDFNAATGQEFIDLYRPYLPAQFDRIADISIRTSVISLPISLKYYLPLQRSWSLFFQTGTSFDVSAFQQVDFESYLRQEERRHSFETDARARFFHNFMFGAGLQYRRPRISAQLSPYYLYDFRSIMNTPKGSNVGIRASIWLDLFK